MIECGKHAKMSFNSILLLLSLSTISDTSRCFTCEGVCFIDSICNCQTGQCTADFCYTERRPDEMRPDAERISKGCIKRPSRTLTGCDFDHFDNRILCICHGDFCNDMIRIDSHIGSLIAARNVTCRHCPDRSPDCDSLCIGNWCYHDTSTGAKGCGYGPPSLPYFKKGTEVLALSRRNELCISLSRGLTAPARRHCICNRPFCNGSPFESTPPHRVRSIVHDNEPTRSLYRCVSCDLSSGESMVTASCKKQYCVGHYCTYSSLRDVHDGGAPNIATRQGCMNVSDGRYVHVGCEHRWIDRISEDITCACVGHLCNSDFGSANRGGCNGDVRLNNLLWCLLLFVHYRN